MANSFQALILAKETGSYGSGTYATTTINTDYIVARLYQDNSFTMRKAPDTVMIRSADGLNRVSKTVSGKYTVKGKLSIPFYVEQSSLLCGMIALNGSNNLNSYVFDHYIQMEDASATLVKAKYSGAKIENWHLSGDAAGQLMVLELDIIAQAKLSSTMSDPAANLYPSNPYLFQQFNGGLSIGGSRTEFNNFDLTIANVLDGTFNESSTISRLKWSGRDVTWNNKLVYQSTTDRTNLEGVTPLTCSAVLTNGANSVTFTMNTNNVITSVEDDLKLGGVFYQNLSLRNQLDSGAAEDFHLTVV